MILGEFWLVLVGIGLDSGWNLSGFHIPERSGNFWEGLGRSRKLWEALGGFGSLQDAVGRYGTRWAALGRSGTLWDDLATCYRLRFRLLMQSYELIAFS